MAPALEENMNKNTEENSNNDKATDRVQVLTILRADGKRSEYAVSLDGTTVLRCGDLSVPAYGLAAGFAAGLRFGLSVNGA